MENYNQFRFEIIQNIAVLSTGKSGWTKEINLVSFNGASPKYDIRTWDPNHEKMGKGITLTKEELGEMILLAREQLEERLSDPTLKKDTELIDRNRKDLEKYLAEYENAPEKIEGVPSVGMLEEKAFTDEKGKSGWSLKKTML